MKERKPVVIEWDEWRASREAKRARLRALGLDAPSRRTAGYGSAEKRLRKAFAGTRVPSLFAKTVVLLLVYSLPISTLQCLFEGRLVL